MGDRRVSRSFHLKMPLKGMPKRSDMEAAFALADFCGGHVSLSARAV